MAKTTPVVRDGYEITERSLRGAMRSDWTVTPAAVRSHPSDAPSFVKAMRRFFKQMDEEIDARLNDPIQTGQALAKMEALLADMRYLTNRLRSVTAEAMAEGRIRRITVEGVATWEETASVSRSNWDHPRIVSAYLKTLRFDRVITTDGEVVSIDEVATALGALYGPSTSPRITPLREAGMNPDEYCDIALDENDKPIKEHSVRMHDNKERQS